MLVRICFTSAGVGRTPPWVFSYASMTSAAAPGDERRRLARAAEVLDRGRVAVKSDAARERRRPACTAPSRSRRARPGPGPRPLRRTAARGQRGDVVSPRCRREARTAEPGLLVRAGRWSCAGDADHGRVGAGRPMVFGASVAGARDDGDARGDRRVVGEADRVQPGVGNGLSPNDSLITSTWSTFTA